MFTYFILMWFVVSVWSQGSCVSRSQKYYRKRTFPPKHTKLLKTRVWFPKANVDYYLFLQILHHVLHMQKYFCGKMELINWFQLEANAEQNTVSNCCWREKHLIFYYVFAVKNVMNARRKKKKTLRQWKLWTESLLHLHIHAHGVALHWKQFREESASAPSFLEKIGKIVENLRESSRNRRL